MPLELLTLFPLNNLAAATGRLNRCGKGWIPSSARSAFDVPRIQLCVCFADGSVQVNSRKCGKVR